MHTCLRLIPVILVLGMMANTSFGQSDCGGGLGADVVVSDIPNGRGYGSLDGNAAFSIATIAANIGTEQLWWHDNSNEKPVISQHVYVLKDGRLRQIGIGWLKHGFGALQQAYCECVPSGSFYELGVGCADTYTSGLNGNQSLLGPRFEVNAHSGYHPWPATDYNQTGDVTYKRLRVSESEIVEGLNDETKYFATSLYISLDDATNQNGDNNESYRRMYFDTSSNGDWDIDISSSHDPQVGQAAVRIWQDHDPEVVETDVRVNHEGLVIAAGKATDLGNGVWHYEYAVENLNSHRSIRSFKVPIDPSVNVTNIGFNDVNYHSGEPFDATDWPGFVHPTGHIVWATSTYEENPNANAIRWGTTYNFWFDAEVAPEDGVIEMDLFRPQTVRGQGNSVTAQMVVPGNTTVVNFDCNANGVEDADDITTGTSADINGDLLPDECVWECPGDIDRNGITDVDDFSVFLIQFGGSGTADIAGGGASGNGPDGTVDLTDFSAFLVSFGCVVSD